MPVYTPQPCEAIGRALSSAYSATSQTDLPDDMDALLDKLDKLN